jgi:hypothetical protein
LETNLNRFVAAMKVARIGIEELETELAAATEDVEDLRGALQRLALFLSAGMGDDNTSADDYEARIKWGIAESEKGLNRLLEETRAASGTLRKEAEEMQNGKKAVGGVYSGIEWMAAWLLDHAEGETVMEEQLRSWAVAAWTEHLQQQKMKPSITDEPDPIPQIESAFHNIHTAQGDCDVAKERWAEQDWQECAMWIRFAIQQLESAQAKIGAHQAKSEERPPGR